MDMNFLGGVIEGFYGHPWTDQQRRRLFGWMKQWGLNTYIYAPKDDLKHRVHWRQSYARKDAGTLHRLIRAARRQNVHFVYALGPGLDIRYGHPADQRALQSRCRQLQSLGTHQFALFFDDIPGTLCTSDRRRFRTLGRAQSSVANRLLRSLRETDASARLLFCPTEYCDRMAKPSVTASTYLSDLGEYLDPAIDVFWTGRTIIPETLSPADIREVAAVLRRKPLVWDNLFANDYDARRLYLGPYSGRSPTLRTAVKGIVINPNCEFEANYVAVATFGQYLTNRGRWMPRPAWRRAIAGWLPDWQTLSSDSITRSDVEFLADCCYLPFELGPTAQRWVEQLRSLRQQRPGLPASERRKCLNTCRRIGSLFDRIATLKNRELLHALLPRIWDLNEEASLIQDYLDWLHRHPSARQPFPPPSHHPGTFRGGLIASLQQLFPLDANGCLLPSP